MTLTGGPAKVVEPSAQLTLATKLTWPLVWPLKSVKVTCQVRLAIWPSSRLPAHLVLGPVTATVPPLAPVNRVPHTLLLAPVDCIRTVTVNGTPLDWGLDAPTDSTATSPARASPAPAVAATSP